MPAVQLLTVPQAAERLACTESSVRNLIFHAEERGFADCIVRIGRNVRIREDRLAEYIERQTGAPPFQYSSEWRERNLQGARNRRGA